MRLQLTETSFFIAILKSSLPIATLHNLKYSFDCTWALQRVLLKKPGLAMKSSKDMLEEQYWCHKIEIYMFKT